MLRRFRFGFLSLFAAMLLAVSAAGWWKFHHELYLQEVQTLKRIRAPGLRLDFQRAESGWVSAPEDDQPVPWNAALIGPLENLYLYGDAAQPTQEQSEIARSLPRLKAYGELISPSLSKAELQDLRRRKVKPYDAATLIGRELPVIEKPTLDFALLDEPLATGAPVDEQEAERIADEILVAWRKPTARPAQGLTYSQSDDGNERNESSRDYRQLIVWNDESALRHHAYADPTHIEALTLRNGNAWLRYSRRVDRWLPQSWYTGHDSEFDTQGGLRFPDDGFPYYGLTDHNWKLVPRTLDAMTRFELDRVEKIDDVRYRIDFAPFKAVPKPGDQSPNAVTIERWEWVVRSDLDWAPEEVFLFENNPRYPLERRLVQRFRREDGFVVLEERLIEDRVAKGYPQRSRIRYATELQPKVSERAFDPASLGGEVWPDPPGLPVWRWYRVTFALGLALALFIAGRNAAAFLTKRRKDVPESTSTRSSVDRENLPSVESLDTPSRDVD